MVRIAIAHDADLPAMEAYLRTRADTCMFLRSNLRAVGLRWDGGYLQAQYILAWEDEAVAGVVGHAWNGMVIVEAESQVLAELVSAVVDHSGRRVTGFSGAFDQVVAARAALGLTDAPAMLDAEDTLMALTLDRLIVPAPVARGELHMRRATEADRDTLVPWRAAHMLETHSAAASADASRRAATWFEAMLATDAPWVAEQAGTPVAMSAFNARVPDCVQVGAVYTPPPLRRRGYARGVVAGSLLEARTQGVARAILFTPSPDALAAYRAIGFATIGRFSIVMFPEP